MKDSFKRIMKTEIKGIPHEYQWAAFLLPMFLLGAVFLSCRVHPFGDTSLLTCDLFHQYAPILSEIRSKILSGDSLFYTWNMGLGTNFLPIFAYNGASPLNIILLVFPQAYMSDAITLMILLRTGLAGLFFSLMVYKKDGRKGPAVLALSTVYALCGYVLAYFWALMWMDAVVLLPLVILGLWKLFVGEKPRLYVIALFLVILSNFYFGFFVCVFLVLFAPVLYLEARQGSPLTLHPVKAGLRFAGYSIIAAGMTSVLLLPTVLSLRSTSAAAESVVMTPDLSFTFFDFLSRFLLHADPVIREGLPNVYSSVVILILVALYALCRTIPISRRAASLGLAFFLYLSMNSSVLNFFWHGMHYTNQIPYRQAFLLCFLLIYMACQVLLNIEGLSPKKVFYIGAVVLFYLVILNQSGETSKNYWLIYGSAAFVIIYMFILMRFFADEKGRKRAHKLFLYAIILEMFLAAEFSFSYIAENEHFTYAPSYGQFADRISSELSDADNGQFARVVLTPSLTGNDGALYHVKTVSVFASTTSMNFVQFMGGLGFANNAEFELKADGMTEVSARLLGIRYTVNFTGAIPAGDITSESSALSPASVLSVNSASDAVKTDVMYSGYDTQVNEKVLPIGFFVPSEGVSGALDTTLSPFEQTNTLLERIGVEAAYEKGSLTLVSSSNIQKTSETDSYSIMTSGQTSSISFTADISGSDRDVLIYLGTEQEPSVRVSCMDSSTGKNTTTVLESSAGQIVNCGRAPGSGDGTMTVQLFFTSPDAETFPVYCYSIAPDVLDKDTAILGAEPFTVTSFDSTHLKGTVDFSEDGALFTSIPYDAGWSVTIDGTSADTQIAYGALLSVPVAKGFHEIAFSYQPPGFLPGLLISLILTADFILLCIWNPFLYFSQRAKKKSENTRADEKEE